MIFGGGFLLFIGALAIYAKLTMPSSPSATASTAPVAQSIRKSEPARQLSPEDQLRALSASHKTILLSEQPVGGTPAGSAAWRITFSNGHMMVSSVNAPPGDTPASSGQAQIYTSPNGTCLGIEYQFVAQTTDLLCIAVRDFEFLSSPVKRGDYYFFRKMARSTFGDESVQLYRVSVQ